MTWKWVSQKPSLCLPAYPDWADADDVRRRTGRENIQDGFWSHVEGRYILFINDLHEVLVSLISSRTSNGYSWHYLCDDSRKDQIEEALMEECL